MGRDPNNKPLIGGPPAMMNPYRPGYGSVTRREAQRLRLATTLQRIRDRSLTTEIDDEVFAVFLEGVRITGDIPGSAEAVRVWRHERLLDYAAADPGRSALLMEAQAAYKSRVKKAIRRRAIEGVVEKVYFNGQVVGKKRVYSDRLLALEAGAEMPERYGQKSQVDVQVRAGVLVVSAASAAAGGPVGRLTDEAFLDESRRLLEGDKKSPPSPGKDVGGR